MNINNYEPSKGLYLKVRTGFVAQGSALGTWCRENNVNLSNARSCLIGSWDGPRGRKLREEIIVASGIAPHSCALNS
jgi:hypothetical protein